MYEHVSVCMHVARILGGLYACTHIHVCISFIISQLFNFSFILFLFGSLPSLFLTFILAPFLFFLYFRTIARPLQWVAQFGTWKSTITSQTRISLIFPKMKRGISFNKALFRRHNVAKSRDNEEHGSAGRGYTVIRFHGRRRSHARAFNELRLHVAS